jgi:HAD superfamily hydrolase (TIGR01549 family)
VSVVQMSSLIIFDMDDTLVGTRDLIDASFEHAVAEYSSLKLQENEVAMISGYSLSRMLSQRVPAQYLSKALERYHGYFKSHFDTTAKTFPSMMETLTQLREKGTDLAVFTGANRKWTEITLQEAKLSRFFSVVLTADDATPPKPNPEGLRTIMKKLGANSGHTTYVGDEVKDIRASRNASVTAAGALWGSFEREKLRAAADLILEEPLDLVRVLA